MAIFVKDAKLSQSLVLDINVLYVLILISVKNVKLKLATNIIFLKLKKLFKKIKKSSHIVHLLKKLNLFFLSKRKNILNFFNHQNVLNNGILKIIILHILHLNKFKKNAKK